MNMTGWINTIYRKQARRKKRRNNKARITYKGIDTKALEAFADQVDVWARRAKWLVVAVVVVLGLVGLVLLNIILIIAAMVLLALWAIAMVILELEFFPEPLYLVEINRREKEAACMSAVTEHSSPSESI